VNVTDSYCAGRDRQVFARYCENYCSCDGDDACIDTTNCKLLVFYSIYIPLLKDRRRRRRRIFCFLENIN
jgi:hypothetical protein